MKSFTVTGTGDSLFLKDFPAEYAPELQKVAALIGSCDLRITNLETNLADYGICGGAYSGGTWLNTRKEYLPELLKYGFNYCGTANNHVMDYSYAGLLSTLDTLDKAGVAHSGSGRSLAEAAAPAVIEKGGVRSAVFAVDCSHNPASKAGQPTDFIAARPGVNYLDHNCCRKISGEQLEALREIAAATGINFDHDLYVRTGFRTPDPEGVFQFGKESFTTRDDIPLTSCSKKDKKRLTDAIAEAKKSCDHVFILVHCHDNDNRSHENPPEYLKEFVHACADSGVSAVFGGGCHALRGMELYHNVPIFYSLGDFIYQGLQVEYLPADFMEKFGADIRLSAKEALYVRSRGNTVGLHCERQNYLTVLPRLVFENGSFKEAEIIPLQLHFERRDTMNGLPALAEGSEAREILEGFRRLSAPFGTKFGERNGCLTVSAE